MLQSLIRLLIGLSRTATAVAFLVLIGAVLVQVVGRSILNDSPVWTEELTRFALLFLAAFGAGLSLRSGDMVNVDLVVNALPDWLGRALRRLSLVLTLLFALALLAPAWQYTSVGGMQTSPALGWSMLYIHASVLVLLASLALFALIALLESFTA